MFIKSYSAYPLKKAKPETLSCTNCNNTTDHVVFVIPRGFQMGFAFSRKSAIGAKDYGLVCPICGNITKQLTKEQAKTLRE